MEVAQIL